MDTQNSTSGPHRDPDRRVVVERPAWASCPVVLLTSLGTTMVWLVWMGNPSWDAPLPRWLALRLDGWQLHGLVTHALFHPYFLHLAASLAILLYAGRALELRWGSWRFIAFCVFIASSSALAAAVCEWMRATMLGGAIAERWLFGGGAVGIACLGTLAMVEEDRWVLSWISRRYLLWAAILIGATGLASVDHLLSERPPFLLSQLSGLAGAWVFLKILPTVDAISRSVGERRRRARERRLSQVRQRVEQLLEKISVGGIESLSSEELGFLRQASKHYKRAT
jgi:membrane associated rhomboid family serine protease